MNRKASKTPINHFPHIKKKTIAMLLVMAIFISILPDSFTASAAEVIKEATGHTQRLTMQFVTNSAWGGSIAAEIILKNESSQTIKNWKITFNWEPVIASLWCAQYKTEEKTGQEGAAEIQNRYTIYPYEYNQKISPGGEIRIGFIASGEEAELVKPESYEIELDGENWVYDTKEDSLKKPEETEKPTIEPELTKAPEITKEPEVSATPDEPEETAAPEVTEEPTKTPEITEKPTEEPEKTATPEETAAPEITEEPENSTEPEITASPEITEQPTAEPKFTPDPTVTPEPTKDPDYNLEEYEFTDDLVITTDTKLTKNTSCKNLYIKKGTLSTEGYQLQVRENTIQTGGKLQVTQGSRLEIKKDYEQSSGTHATETKTAIKGNYNLTGDALLRMKNTQSHVITHGDLTITSDGWQEIAEGELEIKGNLTIEPQWWIHIASSIKIKLSGSKTQKISTPNKSLLYHLDLTESAGAEFKNSIRAYTIKGIENIKNDTATLEVDTVSIEKDTYIPCSIIIKNGKWNTGKHSLTIKGDLYQESGRIDAEEGKLEIKGNYSLTGEALLCMKNAQSHVITHGDFTITSDGWQEIAEGELEIKGNLTIEPQWWIHIASGIKIKLSGSKTQTISTPNKSLLYHLDLTESAGAEFKNSIRAYTIKGIENIKNDTATLEVDTVSIEKDTYVPCNIIIKNGKWNTGKHSLIIEGDLYQESGRIEAEEGKLEIWGNYHLAGEALLRMKNAQSHVITHGDFTITSDGWQEIAEGELEIKGNLTIEPQWWIRQASSIKIKLSGSKTQTISTPNKTQLYHLDLAESAGAEFKNSIRAYTIKGIENIENDTATLEVDTVSIEKDTYVPCSIILKNGKWNTGKHSLIIEGDLYQESGRIDTEEGKLEIWGDYHLAGDSLLRMKNAQSHVITHGDLTITSDGWQEIAEGELEIKGNLTIEPQWWIHQVSEINIKLSGSRRQKIKVTEGTYLYNLDITQSAGAEFATAIHADTLNGIEKLTGEEKTLYVGQAYLTEDAVLRGDLTIGEGRVNINGHLLKLQGDLIIKKGTLSTAVQNSHTEIQGRCTMESGMLDIGKGSIQIRKKCQLNGMADINMHDKEGVLILGKSLTADGHSTLGMAEGNVYLGGDLTQTEEAGWINLQIGAILHLNGDSTQTISLEKPSALRFAHIDMTQSAGVNYASAVHIQKIDGWDKLKGESLILCGYNDILRENINYTGHLRLVGSILRLGSHTLGTGWLEQYDSRIEIQEGKLTVAANHGLYGMSALEMTDKRGSLEVHGDLTTYSEISHRGILTAGDIYLWGNLSAYGTNYCFAVSDSLTVHFMQHYLDLSDPNSGSIQEVYMRDPEASYIPEANKDIPYGATVNFIHAQDMEVTPDTLLYYFSAGVAEEITHAQEHFPEYAGMSALFAVLAKIGPVLGAKVTVAGTKIVGEAAAGLIAESIGIMAAGLVVVLMAGPIIKDLYINYGNPNQAAKQIGQSLTNLTIYAAMTAVISGGIALATEKEARELVKNILAEIKTILTRFQSDNRGESRYLADLMAGITGTEAVQKEISAYLTEQAAAQTKNLPKEILNKAEAILRKYFGGRTLDETEFRFLLRHLDDLEGKDLADGIEWAIQNNKTLSNLADDAIDYCYKKWAGYEEDGILESIQKAIAEKGGKATAEDVKKFADDAVRALSAKDMSIISSIIDKIPSRYKELYQCDGFAKNLTRQLDKEGISYEIVRVDSKVGIYSDKVQDIIGINYHYGIRIGENIYDNITLEGMKFDLWLEDLGLNIISEDISWSYVETILNY